MAAPKVDERVLKFGVSPTLKINEAARDMRRAGREVAHLGFGQSPFLPPKTLCDALAGHAAAQEYLPAAGLEELREAATAYHCQKMGLVAADYTALIGPGSKPLLLALQMAVPGDVMLIAPSWVSYAPQAVLTGSAPIWVRADIGEEYVLPPERLEAALKEARQAGKNPTKIIVSSPNNPTGLKMPVENMKQIAEICRREGLLIIADEIYGLVDFAGTPTTIATFAPENTVITTGLSKHLSLGGWRVGVAFIPRAMEDLILGLRVVASEIWSSATTPVQKAAVEAYGGLSEVEEHLALCTRAHQKIMTWMHRELTGAGLECAPPTGSFYLMPDWAPFKNELAALGVTTSLQLAEHILENWQVTALPGTAFGLGPEELRLRLSGTDYEGAPVLAALRQTPEISGEELAKAHAPRLFGGVARMAAMLADISTAPRAKAL